VKGGHTSGLAAFGVKHTYFIITSLSSILCNYAMKTAY